MTRTLVLTSIVLFLVACSDDDKKPAVCTPGDMTTCESGEICEITEFGEPACFAPVMVQGMVFDLSNSEAVAGALVVARDENGAAQGDVVTTDAAGNYEMLVPVTRTDEEGAFDGKVLTLRVDAEGYQSYPGSFRPSLPIDLDEANAENDWTIKNAATDVALVVLEGDTSANGTITGVAPEGAGGLVVASGATSITGVVGADGSYTLFNVPAGSYTVSVYLGGQQYDEVTAEVVAGETTSGVDFTRAESSTLATVDGNVNIVNAPGGSLTSVVLVVEDTFQETFARGEVPPGLRAGEVGGAFVIENVPNGRYVVLAAFENDLLVRDPDTSIGGTQIVHIEVVGTDITVPESFKVTEALTINKPGAEQPEAVTSTPTFEWEDDSSEDGYTVVVYDSYGQLIWEDDTIPSVSGSEWVSVEYGGPALELGMYYQWRATSMKNGVPLSTTEDLRGLFYLSE